MQVAHTPPWAGEADAQYVAASILEAAVFSCCAHVHHGPERGTGSDYADLPLQSCAHAIMPVS